MALTVRMTVLTGRHQGQRFCFRGPTNCVVGRASDCCMRFSGADHDCSISRHHCRLIIDPPRVLVQDMNSTNGTFLNSGEIHDAVQAAEFLALFEGTAPVGVVRSGDIITIGRTSLEVDVVDCPPDLPVAEKHEPLWKKGETTKKDCPIPCQFQR